jgi:hypothetical protein
MRDYASRGASATADRQRISGRHPAGAGRGRKLKIVGIMAVLAMLMGIAGSVWFGVALQAGLSSLDKGRQEQVVLLADNEKLNARKAAFLQQDKIEAAANTLGLYPPSEKQRRKP